MPTFPGGWELMVILAVLVVLFGASRLPKAAEGMGKALKIFKREVRDGMKDGDEDKVTPQPVGQQASNGVPADPTQAVRTEATQAAQSAEQPKQ